MEIEINQEKFDSLACSEFLQGLLSSEIVCNAQKGVLQLLADSHRFEREILSVLKECDAHSLNIRGDMKCSCPQEEYADFVANVAEIESVSGIVMLYVNMLLSVRFTSRLALVKNINKISLMGCPMDDATLERILLNKDIQSLSLIESSVHDLGCLDGRNLDYLYTESCRNLDDNSFFGIFLPRVSLVGVAYTSVTVAGMEHICAFPSLKFILASPDQYEGRELSGKLRNLLQID